jgi:hypothetical protein
MNSFGDSGDDEEDHDELEFTRVGELKFEKNLEKWKRKVRGLWRTWKWNFQRKMSGLSLNLRGY